MPTKNDENKDLFENIEKIALEIIEIQTGDYLSENDIEVSPIHREDLTKQILVYIGNNQNDCC